MGEALFKAPSPVQLSSIKFWLQHYLSSLDAGWLLAGFTSDFAIHCEGPQKAYSAYNLQSVWDLEHVVRDKLRKEKQKVG